MDEERSSPHAPTPLWWMLLWIGWGTVICLLVFWLDENPAAALAWLAGGTFVGTCGWRLLQPLAIPVFEWYHSLLADEQRDMRMFQLLERGKSNSAELKGLIEDEAFGMFLGAPLLVGLLHGVLMGGIGGALCRLDAQLPLSASSAAVIGILAAPMLLSFMGAIVFAVCIPQPKHLHPATKWLRRAWMAMSPLLIVPLAWHCLKYLTLLGRGQASADPG